jgi:hypothetical protein
MPNFSLVVSVVTLACGAVAMLMAASTSSYAAPMQPPVTNNNNVEAKTEAKKTSTSTELEQPNVAEIDTEHQIAVTSADSAISFPTSADSSLLVPIPSDTADSDSITRARAAEINTERQVAVTPAPAAISSLTSDDSSLLEPIPGDTADSDSMTQVTSVSQLSDIQPTDWVFQALKSLVERYGCIAGYPDRLYRGQRAINRYEFAASLNACLNKINELLSSGLANQVRKEDLAALQKMQEEFAAELAAIRDRVDALEAKTARLEARQFSTTTTLNGLAFVNITGARAGYPVRRELGFRAPGGVPATENVSKANITLSNLVWLNLLTSFTGRDLLTTQLVAGNGNSPANQFVSAGLTNTAGVPFTDQTAAPNPNHVAIQELNYQFPVFNDRTILKIGPRIVWYRIFDTNRFTVFFNGAGSFNSINSTLSSPVKQGSGAVLLSSLGNKFDVAVGYLAESNTFLPSPPFNSASNPREGLTGGTNIFTAQLTFKPTQDINLRLLYNRINQQAFMGQVGGFAPINGLADDGFGGSLRNGQSNVYIANFDWLITPRIGLFGRYSFSNTNLNPTNSQRPTGKLTAQSFQVGLAFPDLFKRGAQATISFGMPFDYTSGRKFLVSGGGNGGTEYDLEAEYFLPLTQNIAIVPNLYFIFNPNNFSNNPTIFVGNLRLQFNF